MLSDTAGMPPWKKQLILKLRSKSAQLVAPQTANSGVHQPSSPATTCSSSNPNSNSTSSAVNGVGETRVGAVLQCNSPSPVNDSNKMVQERIWMDQVESSEKSNDSDSSEELKYGPGIVSKLKNRYLNLTLREASMKTRPSILNMRKATSLEHVLDKDEPNKKEFQHYNMNGHSKHIPNRYRSAARKPDMKRARSVEYISNAASNNDNNTSVDVKAKRESLHEDMLTANRKEEIDKKNEINDIKTFSSNLHTKVNRPKRLQPIMAEKEKPPIDVVKQTKKIFERPECRTKSPIQTGEVAAKVATFKEIISTKKPPLKQKPVCTSQVPTKPNTKEISRNKPNKITPMVPTLRSPTTIHSPPVVTKKTLKPALSPQNSLPSSPIPDVSVVETAGDNEKRKSSLTETPDLILHSSQNQQQIPEEPETIPINGFNHQPPSEPASSSDEDVPKKIPQNQNLGNSMMFDFSAKPKTPNYLPIIESTKSSKVKRSSPITTPKAPPKSRSKPPPPPVTVNVPITEPLKVEVTTATKKPNLTSPHQQIPTLLTTNNKKESSTTPQTNGKLISDIVNEKNLKNAAKNSEPPVVPSSEVVKIAKKPAENAKIVETAKGEVIVPKVSKRAPKKQEQQNCLVFDFTTRKDVPDYVGNDGRIKTGKIEKPKPGEGGFTLLPGATLDESLIDDDEDWKKSLEGPPSPLLVTFVNDNVLIDGKSSLSQKTKRPKMSIKFVECEPNIFEYPSESSIIGDETSTTQMFTNSSSVGHNVPNMTGLSLANYKSKTAHQIEDFQLGMKPTTQANASKKKLPDDHQPEEESNEDSYQPIAFSAGTNTDILF